ncbi:MAG: ATP-binding protein [Gaiellaceae bacterium]
MQTEAIISLMPSFPQPAPYHDRLVEQHLDALASELSAFSVVGPRAVGKTRTIERRAQTAVRLNVAAEAAAFQADPDAALVGLAEPVLLDEWQTVPNVLRAVANAVNEDPRPARFFLTGSARAELENEPWPGTGRIQRIAMYPMTVGELQEHGKARFLDKLIEGEALVAPRSSLNIRDYLELAVTGGFPRPALELESARVRAAWFDSYIADLLTHDVEQVEEPRTKRRDPIRMRRYFEAYALNSAGVCDQKTIFDAAGVRKETAAAYEELLERLYVIEQVPAWMTNRLARLIHRPKRYVIDAALMAHLLRLDLRGIMRDGDMLGRVLDAFVTAQLRPEVVVSQHRPRLFHLRTEGGRREVDLVVELGGNRVLGIEIKANAAPTATDARHLEWLRDQLGDRFVAGVVLHTGPRVFTISDRITAAPISSIWTA